MGANTKIGFLIILVTLGATTPFAAGQNNHIGEATETKIKPGDVVVVIGERVTLQAEGKTPVALQKGVKIRVTHVRDVWIGGSTTIDDKTLRGWVNVSDVVPAVVIDNGSNEPCSYQVRLSGSKVWGQLLTIAPGQRQTFTPNSRLIVRLQNGDTWTTWAIDPGKHVRYQRDAVGGGELVDCRFDDPKRPQTRQIAVLCMADETYRRIHPDWKDRIAEIVATASACYEDTFALRLKMVDCRPWQFEAARHGNMPDVLKALIESDRADADELVVGWISVAQEGVAENQYSFGCWNAFGRHLVIADVFSTMRTTRALVHCVARTFGAFGVVDRRSVMHHELGTTYPIEFGDAARQVIWLTRDFDLRDGVRSIPEGNARRIQELYRDFHHPQESANDDPIKNGYRTLRLYPARPLHRSRDSIST